MYNRKYNCLLKGGYLMFVFKTLKDNKIYDISRGNFEKITQKKFPYCQEINSRIRYFALCPSCGNPINFINLYIEDQQDGKRKKTIHGRHFTSDVYKLASFYEEKYEKCRYHDKNANKLYTDQPGKIKNREVVRLIETYPLELKESLEEILGFKISEVKFQNFLDDFIASKGYYFESISKFNLPYYFLYLLPNENLYNCLVLNEENICAINTKSQYFEVDTSNRLKRKSKEFSEFEFILVNYKKESDHETLDYKLIERQKEDVNEILKRTIKIKETLFYNKICDLEAQLEKG